MLKSTGLKKVKIIDLVYFLLSVWVAVFILKNSMLDSVNYMDVVFGKIIVIIRLLLIGLAVYESINRGIDKKKTIILACFFFIVVLSYLLSHNWLAYDMFFIAIMWGKRLNYSKVIKIFGVAIGVTMIVIFILYYLGVMPQFTYYSSRNGRIRTTLGFHSPGALAESMMVVLFMIFLSTYRKSKFISIFLFTICAAWIYLYPNNITVSITLILVMVCRFFCDWIRAKSLLIKRLVMFICLLLLVGLVTTLYVFLYTGVIDNLHIFKEYHTLYARLNFGRIGLLKYGVTLFGTPYENVGDMSALNGNSYFIIDCLYFLMPIRYGIVPTILLFIIYYMLMRKTYIEGNSELFSIMIAMIAFSITSSFLTLFPMSFIFICAFSKYQPQCLEKRKVLRLKRI